ncbi:hybrid sensor histidine kinase/response regulator [Pseudanabaena mucicola]|uniref:histidine kinase n=1 Tax=Pseudanabaena mucicola FACHB-723 TaxID=2692860 RepID=A0ABR7ZRX4_9CYAN|nr:hybrid sensor histidine kinase/response regulator [Pseudanabaena mucicola]MBD2186547.1 response regulator [Pseudanabaena mucicola FACHB-723]
MNSDQQQQRIMGYFIEEAREHLQTIEQGVLNLQDILDDSESINELFRAAHSIKGGSAMLGVSSIQHVSHRLEDFFKIIKENSQIKVDERLKSLLLAGFDPLAELLDELQSNHEISEELTAETNSRVKPIFAELESYLNQLVQDLHGDKSDSSVDKIIAEPLAPSKKVVFQQEVTTKMRDMLQIFRMEDNADSRSQLQGICDYFQEVGDTFKLANWNYLITQIKTAIAQQDHSYRNLAPILIREIKDAQELVLTERESEVTVSEQLQNLLPYRPVIDEDDEVSTIFTTSAGDITEGSSSDINQDLAFVDSEPNDDAAVDQLDWDGLDQQESEFAILVEQNAEDAFDLTSIDDSQIDQTDWMESEYDIDENQKIDEGEGLKMEAPELQTLASLFENDSLDFDTAWEDMQTVENQMAKQGSDVSMGGDDFADLLGDDSPTSQFFGAETNNEDSSMDLLFGDFSDEPSQPEEVADDLFPEDLDVSLDIAEDQSLPNLDFTDAVDYAMEELTEEEPIDFTDGFTDAVIVDSQTETALEVDNLDEIGEFVVGEPVDITEDVAIDLPKNEQIEPQALQDLHADETLDERLDAIAMEDDDSSDPFALTFFEEEMTLLDDPFAIGASLEEVLLEDSGEDVQEQDAFVENRQLFDEEQQIEPHDSYPEILESGDLDTSDTGNLGIFAELGFDNDDEVSESHDINSMNELGDFFAADDNGTTGDSIGDDIHNALISDSIDNIAEIAQETSPPELNQPELSADEFFASSESDASLNEISSSHGEFSNTADLEDFFTDSESPATDFDFTHDAENFDYELSNAEFTTTDDLGDFFDMEEDHEVLADELAEQVEMTSSHNFNDADELSDFFDHPSESVGESRFVEDVLEPSTAANNAESLGDFFDTSEDIDNLDDWSDFGDDISGKDDQPSLDFFAEVDDQGTVDADLGGFSERSDMDTSIAIANDVTVSTSLDNLADFFQGDEEDGDDISLLQANEDDDDDIAIANISDQSPIGFDEISELDALNGITDAAEYRFETSDFDIDQNIDVALDITSDNQLSNAEYAGEPMAASADEFNFDDLEAMIGEVSNPLQDINNAGGNFNQQFTPSPTQPPSANFNDDINFDDLEALLGDESGGLAAPVTEVQPANRVVDMAQPKSTDDFDELESMLQTAFAKDVGPIKTRAANRPIATARKQKIVDSTMRVDVKYLDSLNNLVGELVVNRNLLAQEQERLQQFITNLLHQVQLLGDVSQRMRDQYDRSLLEASLTAGRGSRAYAEVSSSSFSSSNNSSVTNEFEGIEFDRYNAFHVLSQEIIELIVRVRESASDIEFVVGETDQVTRQLGTITTQVQDDLKQSRMVPFAQITDRLPRGIRDRALKSGKQAELEIFGRETLIDKAILESLTDPLTHLVNNAIDHGLEDPATRQAAGKMPVGRLTVRAYHQGNQTVISISDDGAGISTEKVKKSAVAKGVRSQSEVDRLNDTEVYGLLFEAGFSTAAQADEFKGRGVGLDVVKTCLDDIRGAIIVESELGKGTTFTIRLPLTLSISKAIFCISDRARVAFPVDGCEDMMEVPTSQIMTDEHGQSFLNWRDTVLPLQHLSNLLSYSRHLSRSNVYGKQENDEVCIIVLRNDTNYMALQVDQFLGEYEIVIKQLEGPIPQPAGIAGATVLGDGRVMAIANVLELFDIASGRLRPLTSGMTIQPMVEEDVTADPTVLIVDDSITVRELLSLTFAKVGYRVEQAKDGQDAWEKLRAGLPCDMIFCDIEMPRMDGLELLSKLQEDPRLNHIPVAMLTSRGADRHRQSAIQFGAKGYFTKPYLEEELLSASKRLLNGETLPI